MITGDRTVDKKSGIRLDVMSLAVFSFFPETKRPYLSREFDLGETGIDSWNKDTEMSGLFVFRCGSVAEKLELPKLRFRHIKDREEWLYPDCDQMHSFTHFAVLLGLNDFHLKRISPSSVAFVYKDCRPIKSLLELQPLKHSHGFCHIKVRSVSPTSPIYKVTANGYLDRPKIQSYFQNFIHQSRSSFLEKAWPTKADELYQTERLDGAALPGILPQMYTSDKWSIFQDMEYDYVLSLPFKCPSQVQEAYLERIMNKDWPTDAKAVKRIFVNRGCHAVPKYHPKSTNPRIEWRISFSIIERDLALTLSDMQRTCYRVLKGVIRSEINDKVSKEQKLPTYYLKTTLFWLCEDTADSFWKPNNLGTAWFCLLEKITEFLENGHLPNYIMPECNLIEKESAKTRQMWTKCLKQIRAEPVKAFRQFWHSYSVLAYYDPDFWAEDTIPEILKQIPLNESEKTLCCIYGLVQLYLMIECNLVDIVRLSLLFLGQNLNRLEIIERLIYSYKSFSKIIPVRFQDRLAYKQAYYSSLFFAEIGNLSLEKVKLSGNKTMEQSAFKEIEKWFLKAMDFPISDRHSGTPVKYANFLRATNGYQAEIEVLYQAMIENKWYKNIKPECNYSKYVDDILDVCQQIELAGEDETSISSLEFAYHLLCDCYIKTGVFAEVCIPNTWLLIYGPYTSKNESLKIERVTILKHLGYQYIAAGLYPLASQCYLQILESGIGGDKLPLRSLLFCLAAYFCKCSDINTK